LAGSPTCDDDLRKTLNAWVLGLPRGRGGAISTGYTLRSISRRASPILVAYHTRVNSLGEGAYISILFSADWPTEVEWYGAGHQRIAIDLNRLCDAYTIAVNELTAYLQRLGIVTSSIWP
jgi:CRISPR-associated protein Cmr1